MSKMSSKTKIFVGRLPEHCLQADLQSLFAKYGTVKECDIIADYGFVHMSTPEEADAAIKGLHNHELNGSKITVQLSTSRPRSQMRGMNSWGRYARGNALQRPYRHWGHVSYPRSYYERSPYRPPPSPSYDYGGRYDYYRNSFRAPPPPVDTYGSFYSYDTDYGTYDAQQRSRRQGPYPANGYDTVTLASKHHDFDMDDSGWHRGALLATWNRSLRISYSETFCE